MEQERPCNVVGACSEQGMYASAVRLGELEIWKVDPGEIKD